MTRILLGLLLLVAPMLIAADIDRIFTTTKDGFSGITANWDDQFPIIELDSTGWTASASRIWVQASGWSPVDFGGVEYNDALLGYPLSLQRFRVQHPRGSFVDVRFQKRYVVSESLWVAPLDSLNAYDLEPGSYSWQTDLSTLDVDTTMKCYADWWGPPIWDGNRNVICFTTDDGRHDNYDYWYPVAETLGVTFTAFIYPTTVDSTSYLTKAEIFEMYDYGIEIAAHGYSSAGMLSYEDSTFVTGTIYLGTEIVDAKRAIEDFMWTHDENYFCHGLSLPLNETNGFINALIKATYEYCRISSRSGTFAVGDRANDNVNATWHTLRPYDITRIGETLFFNSGGTLYDSTQVDSATTARLTSIGNLSDMSYLGGTITRKNFMIVISVHDDTDMTAAGFESFWNAVINYNAANPTTSYGIMTLKDAIENWRQAHNRRQHKSSG